MTDEQAKASAVIATRVSGVIEAGLHQYALRCSIARMRDTDDLVEAEIVETVTNELRGALGGKTLAPLSSEHPASRFSPRQRRELLGLELLRQRVDELVQIAVHDRVDLVERQIDPMIGPAPLRKVVRANALAAIARADQALAMRRLLLL